MPTPREQLEAYQFGNRRLIAALVSGDPDERDRPLRRLAVALLGGLVVGALAVVLVGAYGLLGAGSYRPVAGDTLIMRETGARFALVDGTLHPIPNWSSALLIDGTGKPATHLLPRSALAAYPVGDPLGIAGAPDPPPQLASLLGRPWATCSVPAGSAAPTTKVLVGREPAGTPTTADPTLLVYAGSERSLLWQGRSYRIPNRPTLTALGLDQVGGIRVTPELLTTITAGPDLVAPAIAGRGGTSSARIGGAAATIGAVYRSGGSYYVVTAAGLAPVGELTARLLMIAAPGSTEISAGEVAAHRVDPITQPALPSAVPALATDHDQLAMVCASHRGDEGADRMSTVLGYPAADAQQLADDGEVVVQAGHGALVRSAATADGVRYLVTDQGVRYPLRDSVSVDAAVALGYAGYQPVSIPEPMLALVPTGPTLDPAAARATSSGR